MEYPVNCRKLYPKLSPEDAIRQGKADGRKTLEVNTIDGYITALSSLCSYAVKEGYIANNPAAGQGMKKTWEDAKRESKARLPFNEEDLARTFSVASYPKREENPTFDAKGRGRILDFAKRANFQWILKIVLYSIRISDIYKSNGRLI